MAEVGAAPAAERRRSRLVLAVRGFFPGYFALVIATGVVSLAAYVCGHDAVARAMLWTNVVVYPTLLAWLLTFAGTLRALGWVLLGVRA